MKALSFKEPGFAMDNAHAVLPDCSQLRRVATTAISRFPFRQRKKVSRIEVLEGRRCVSTDAAITHGHCCT